VPLLIAYGMREKKFDVRKLLKVQLYYCNRLKVVFIISMFLLFSSAFVPDYLCHLSVWRFYLFEPSLVQCM
jgi:hypothetical protein